MDPLGRVRTLVARAARRREVEAPASSASPAAAAPPTPSALAQTATVLADTSVTCILDAGAHQGDSPLDLLATFPDATIHAFEPDAANHAAAVERLAAHGTRVRLHRVALADREGAATLHVNTHDGTHSLLAIGAQRYWAAWAGPVADVDVPVTTIDAYCGKAGIERIDLLKMDIQGSELRALQGAQSLLARGAIGAILLEVELQPLYHDQPLLWDIGAFLAAHGYALAPCGLMEPYIHAHNPRVLAWAEALFLAPSFLAVPEWEPPR